MINNHVLSEVRTTNKIEALTRQVAKIKAVLPDNFTKSKDWAFDSDPVSRIEWLKTFHAEHRAEIERLEDQCCCWKETADMLQRQNDAAFVELRSEVDLLEKRVAEQQAEIERLKVLAHNNGNLAISQQAHIASLREALTLIQHTTQIHVNGRDILAHTDVRKSLIKVPAIETTK